MEFTLLSRFCEGTCCITVFRPLVRGERLAQVPVFFYTDVQNAPVGLDERDFPPETTNSMTRSFGAMLPDLGAIRPRRDLGLGTRY